MFILNTDVKAISGNVMIWLTLPFYCVSYVFRVLIDIARETYLGVVDLNILLDN